MWIVLAALGAIDSLLTSLVADNMSQTRYDLQRTHWAGIGNAVGGFLRSSWSGATMRTVINVQSGGKLPISGMTHSIILLFVLVAFGPFAAVIPKLLAAIFSSWFDIIDWRFLFRAHNYLSRLQLLCMGFLY